MDQVISKDYIATATAADYHIRAFACTTRNMCEESRRLHNTSPVMSAALGRTLTAAAMMSIMMKGDNDKLTIQIKSDGPSGGLTVCADSHGNVKGYTPVPDVILPAKSNGHLNVSGAIGNGDLIVVKDLGLKEPYVGRITLQTGEIAEDMTYYFAASEQTPSSVGLGVLMNMDNTVRCSGGFIIQLMPDATDDDISVIENNLKSLKSVTEMLDAGMTPENMIEEVLAGLDVRFNETYDTAYKCDCSEERVERALISLGEKEIVALINENKDAEIHCDFCERDYIFGPDRLKEILKKSRALMQ
ncbi:MAG: Hsp33 family molecular chaperone HslO [Lachnospiraceae bacterium]|nr:Hsp33 family molecular chaperone HslO [Lachnospiraceae bacterium]MBP1584131.1 Hsp33 family molecular chaperone HslO [Lachnospiraceae bacterium]